MIVRYYCVSWEVNNPSPHALLDSDNVTGVSFVSITIDEKKLCTLDADKLESLIQSAVEEKECLDKTPIIKMASRL